MFKIFLIDKDRNDATDFYVRIIERSLYKLGEECIYINDVSQVKKSDKILTINPDVYKLAYRKHPAIILHWFQGVLPEESWFNSHNKIRQLAAFLYYTMLERKILRTSTLNFFVSNTMKKHYEKKYGYKGNNFKVMPCFNQKLSEDAFTNDKYASPSFVYTGNLAKWQCFIPMVKLFHKIKQKIPRASLTIYTEDNDKAREILLNYNIDAEIRYVPYQQLSSELKQFKYGFLLREDDIVNNVATPTKINTYLANGIIPIYTDVVGAYKENLSHLKYSVPLVEESHLGIEKLYKIERSKILGNDVINDFKTVFTHYYNVDYYVESISSILKPIISSIK